MKAKSLIFCAVAVIFATSCSKEFAQIEQKGVNELKISGTMDFGPATRISLSESDSTATFNWQVGDSIYVFNKVAEYTKSSKNIPQVTNYNRVRCVVTAVDKSGKATFTPVAGEDLTVLDSSNKTYYACTIGEQASTTRDFLFADNVINMVYPSTTSGYEPGKIDNNRFYAVAKTTIGENGELNFVFKPLTSYAKITIPDGVTVQKIRIVTWFQKDKNKQLTFYGQLSFDEDGNIASVKRTNGYKQGGAANAAFMPAGESFASGTYYFPICGYTDNKIKYVDIQYVLGTNTNFTYGDSNDESVCKEIAPCKIYDFGTVPPNPAE